MCISLCVFKINEKFPQGYPRNFFLDLEGKSILVYIFYFIYFYNMNILFFIITIIKSIKTRIGDVNFKCDGSSDKNEKN